MSAFFRPLFRWSRKHEPVPVEVGAADLERFLTLSRPADPVGQLRLLLLVVFLNVSRLSREEITELARRRWDLHQDKTAELLRGNVEFGFRWYSLHGVLRDCGVPQVYIDTAYELFHEFSRRDIAPPQPSAAPEPAETEPADVVVEEEAANPVEEPVEDHAGPMPGSRPDPKSAHTKDELLALLAAFRVWNGRVSFRKMEKVIGKRYVHSTLAAVPHREHLPSLDLVLAYIEGCGGDAADLEAWESAWRRIALSETGG
ncbi:hypothetical protein [Spirillospora sp. NPDC047279]|uniref:hypothetical protein n=1 Tax=Spirillospora sp. NPDC047279 TaxID=3155478 RepID=UPI0033CC7055